MYFLTKTTYQAISVTTGKIEKISDQYLVNADNFSQAEVSTINTILIFTPSSYQIDSISRYKVSEIIDGIGDFYFDVKCIMIIFDEDSGKEKRVPVPYLIKSTDIKNAESGFRKFMSETLSDYEIAKIGVTKIVDVL